MALPAPDGGAATCKVNTAQIRGGCELRTARAEPLFLEAQRHRLYYSNDRHCTGIGMPMWQSESCKAIASIPQGPLISWLSRHVVSALGNSCRLPWLKAWCGPLHALTAASRCVRPPASSASDTGPSGCSGLLVRRVKVAAQQELLACRHGEAEQKGTFDTITGSSSQLECTTGKAPEPDAAHLLPGEHLSPAGAGQPRKTRSVCTERALQRCQHPPRPTAVHSAAGSAQAAWLQPPAAGTAPPAAAGGLLLHSTTVRRRHRPAQPGCPQAAQRHWPSPSHLLSAGEYSRGVRHVAQHCITAPSDLRHTI